MGKKILSKTQCFKRLKKCLGHDLLAADSFVIGCFTEEKMPTTSTFPGNETLSSVAAIAMGINESKSNSKVVLFQDCHSNPSRNFNDKKKIIVNKYVYDQELNSIPYVLSWF